MVFIKTLLADCGDSDGCSGFQVNADKAGYLGLSVGGLIGQLTVAMSPEIKALALTNTGIGVVELLGNSNPFYRCPLVDLAIGFGLLDGQTYDSEDDLDALCLNTDASDPNSYLNNPAWLQLESTYKWVLDWGESANFVPKTVARNIPTLIQMAENDHTMPNLVTRKAAEAYQAGAVETQPTFGADGYSTEIDDSDFLFLNYVDVEGQRQYEHDILSMPTPRIVCLHPDSSTPCTDADHAKFQEWVAGNRHYQADVARFFEKHLNAAGN